MVSTVQGAKYHKARKQKSAKIVTENEEKGGIVCKKNLPFPIKLGMIVKGVHIAFLVYLHKTKKNLSFIFGGVFFYSPFWCIIFQVPE